MVIQISKDLHEYLKHGDVITRLDEDTNELRTFYITMKGIFEQLVGDNICVIDEKDTIYKYILPYIREVVTQVAYKYNLIMEEGESND